MPHVKQPLPIVTDEGRIEEVITRLAGVGYNNAKGYLKGGFNTREKEGNIGKPLEIEIGPSMNKKLNNLDKKKCRLLKKRQTK